MASLLSRVKNARSGIAAGGRPTRADFGAASGRNPAAKAAKSKLASRAKAAAPARRSAAMSAKGKNSIRANSKSQASVSGSSAG